MALPRSAARLLTRAVIAPLLSPRLPLPVSRRLLDLTGHVVPVPAGTRRTRAPLGGVPGERVTARGATGPHQVLYLHGGGYKTGSPASHRGLTAHLSRAAAAPVHVPDYRLAPEHPFPAALDDALAAWHGLRAAGHAARHIAVLGDSAGGGLALSLVLRLRADGADLPGSLGLISPWLDLDLTSPWVVANGAVDAMLDPGMLGPAAAQYRGDATDAPELRPLEADLAGLPPVHVVAGADEVLVGDADAFVERARGAGVEVTYTRAAGLWHAYPVLAGLLAEADVAVAGLGAAAARDCRARRPRVAVVGAGFGGIGMAAALRRSGTAEVTLLDRADGVGGVWRANTYPGAACDVPSHLYSFSFAPGHEWTRRFAPQPDILRYLERVARDHDVAPRLSTEVTEAHWDEARSVWRLDLSDGDTLEADVLVPACGQLSRPAIPRLPGLESFTGPVFHSARWRHDVDLTGKRVAVVGTGASAVQFVPAIVDRVAAMTVFQRSAPYLIPKPDRRYGPGHRTFLRAAPAWRTLARAWWTLFFESGALGFTRLRAMSAPFGWAHAAMLRTQVRDERLRERLRPDYPVGCKRVGISSDWFPALTRPHVDVVTEAITAVTPTGVRTADGAEHPADVIILGTGFTATQFLTPMKVFGPGGAELSDRWRSGARAHLGITVPGFPNLFLLYGPNTNVGSGSIVHMLECQIGYVHQAVRALAGGLDTLTVREDVAARFDTEMQRRLANTVWTQCSSWYRTASGRVVNNWPGLMREYRRRTNSLHLKDYETSR